MPGCVRGSVLEVNVDPSVGREYMKTPPCLVVQSDRLNRYSQLTVVVPITGAENIKKLGPTFIPIPKGEANLQKDSVAVCHQARVIDESRLGKVYGHVRPETMQAIVQALQIVFELD